MNYYDTVRLLLLRQTLRRRDHWTRHQLERHQAQALSSSGHMPTALRLFTAGSMQGCLTAHSKSFPASPKQC